MPMRRTSSGKRRQQSAAPKSSPAMGGARTRINNSPEYLLWLKKAIDGNPAIEGSALAKKLGISASALNALEENLNLAARYARRKGIPLEDVILQFKTIPKHELLR